MDSPHAYRIIYEQIKLEIERKKVLQQKLEEEKV